MPRRHETKVAHTTDHSYSPILIPLASAVPRNPTSLPTNSLKSDRDIEEDETAIAFDALGLEESLSNILSQPGAKGMFFPFLELSSELRIEIYRYYFAGTSRVLDLDPENRIRIHKKLGILRVCRTIYREATHLFYSTQCFRIFPTYPRGFFRTKRPLLARLNPQQRACITSLELRLGPGWGKPPRSWVVNPALGLADCVNVKTLTVFVEYDPSDDVFNGFRKFDGFYEKFCCDLLVNVLVETPSIECIYFDANSSVKKSGDMMRGLLEATSNQAKKTYWLGEEMD
ncbi:hypothetical protein TOPH_02390 [Tolypocladium ophioglossoides CBS 100239]|uniref:Uncharacterized protein n=1 Tax=Tolypocladium ophioglossoides (strain CBS 100239) TaxID=1163406 RepID=A0A0L0NGJ1_TOLOC|nr:hypothetical protein TOPH_02390 [Tolypocladium ophioglossoides CBS 100239]